MSAGTSLRSGCSGLTSKNSRIWSITIHGRRRLAHGRHGIAHAAIDRDAGDEADDALLGVGEAVDELGQVVFEEALAIGREKLDGGVVVGGVGGDEAEVAGLAVLVEAHAAQASGDGAILGVGEGFRLDQRELQLALREVAILFEQRLHALEVFAVERGHLAELLGVVEADVDRLLDLGAEPVWCRPRS